jgi:hypothetical protein
MSSEVETSRGETIGKATHPFTSQRYAQFAKGRIRRGGHDSAVEKKEAPPVSQRGPLSICPNYRVIVMQQAPGQQAPPPQQSASLDEIVVVLVSAIIAVIKSRYFIVLSC